MINLLPVEQKTELLLEERLKLILILGIIVLAFLVSLALISFSIKISLSAELDTQKIYFKERKKELESVQIQELEEKIKDLNLTFSELNSFHQGEINLTGVLEKFPKTLPTGIFLTSLNFSSAASQLSLSGFCPNRETLLKFKENLEKEENFEKVYFPPASWVEPTDISFSVTLSIKPR